MPPILRSKPKFGYSGLTVIMSNQSRFDGNELLSGTGGHYFKECLQPETNIFKTDVRLIDDKSPLLDGTKCVLLLGERAHRMFTNSNASLDESHGNPMIVDGIPCISSFLPQDAIDPRNFEATHNPLLTSEDDEAKTEEQAAGEVFESKGRAKTSRANYRFWLKHAVRKTLKILNNDGKIPDHGYKPQYHIRPSSDLVIKLLTETKGQDFYVDLETDFYSLDMRCFAFSFSGSPEDVYVVPILDIEYKPAYGGRTFHIMRALSVAMRDNTTVAHNGSNFDFFVLGYKYHMAIGASVFDTLVAQHRIYPTVEKSLGHCVAYHTFEPYHKNEGVHTYMTREQAEKLYLYCGKDVFTMFLVKKAQDEMASKDEGLKASIKLANDAIRPYLTATLTAIRYDETKRQEWIKENDRKMLQLLRVMGILTGPDIEPLISNKKCVKYFHDALGYDPVLKTSKGTASLKADALYKLALLHENPTIKVLLKYREVQKETGTLNFKPWIAA